ncbi:MAG: diaminopimelate decarboxylase [Firmicutes bacterium]|nr:diaminopimelate decarboxylase [Bacillota bacterium]
MRPDSYRKLPNGQIEIGGVSLKALAATYGTPLYILDYQTLIDRMRRFRDALAGLNFRGRVMYAGKAFLCRAMVELVASEGLGLDVVSGGELTTALRAGMDPGRIVFHGNVKTREEMALALTHRVGAIVVDSLDELRRLDEMARERSAVAPILLRLTPGIEAHTHEFIRTGQFDSKFGFALKDGIADEAVSMALDLSHVRLEGFHAHIGSQILEAEPFVANAEALLQFSRGWWERTGFWPQVLDVGGGFGVRYQAQDEPPEVEPLLRRVQEAFQRLTPPGEDVPELWLEPGRSIVAEAGCTLYTIESVKQVVDEKVYVAVDGGMGDNIRPALYQAAYTAEVDGKPETSALRTVTVAGRYCESGDILIKDARLADPNVDDLLVVWGTGAYNYAMASTYNRVPRPAVVLVHDGEAFVWVERESWDDLVRLDRPLNLANSLNASHG